jgi:hypothetical protein
MNTFHTRREFLSAIGQGMLVASVGAGLASDLNLGVAYADESAGSLSFGALEPLVVLMQETPVDGCCRLWSAAQPGNRPALWWRRRRGQRATGGEDYVVFHHIALSPAYACRGTAGRTKGLPVLKVLYRNTNRIHGRRPLGRVLRSGISARHH